MRSGRKRRTLNRNGYGDSLGEGMPLTLVRPSQIGYGDMVTIDGHSWLVQSIDGPDTNGTYDLYLIGRDGHAVHQVVAEPIQLEV